MSNNIDRAALVMPEYGRGVQQMIEHALTLSDKQERQNCAESIIRVMERLQNGQIDRADMLHKLWNHLARISGYQLDVDYPVEIIPEEVVAKHPSPLPYPMQHIRLRHYGHLMESVFAELKNMPQSLQRDEYVSLVANQMKQCLFTWNSDSMDEELIANDLAHYTEGMVELDINNFIFADVQSSDNSQRSTSRKKRH